MPPLRRPAVFVVLAALVAAAPAAARLDRAAAPSSLLADPGFETLQPWRGYNATLSQADGLGGSRAARVTVTAGKRDFSIYPPARPVASTVAGTRYSASAWLRSAKPGKKVCLRVREWAGSGLAGAAESCALTTSSWKQLPAVSYAVRGSGHALDAYVYEWGAAGGDTFDVDDAVLVDAAAAGTSTTTTATATTATTPTASTTTTATTTAPPAPVAATATAVDHAHVRLDWPAVAGAVSYRLARGSRQIGSTAATTFTDALLWPQTAYSWTVSALDASGAVLHTTALSATTAPLPADGFPRPFGATSFWNTAIPASAPTSPQNAGLISYFVAHAVNPNLSIGEWSVPVAEARGSDPLVSVPCTMYACTLGAFGPVPIPATARQDTSDDGHLAIYDPASGREWDMWQAKGSGTAWSASAGAAVSMAGAGLAPANTGSGNAANFPLLGGLVRPEEILQGRIDHALVFGLPGIGQGAPVCPATHNAPTSSDPNALREGALLQLDPAVDVSALPIPAWAKIVARAMQRYGMYLRDNSGALGVYAENPISRGYDPWRATLGFAAGNDYPSLAGIPWSRFRVVAAPDYPNC